MNGTIVLAGAGLSLAALAAAAILLVAQSRRDKRFQQRVRAIRGKAAASEPASLASQPLAIRIVTGLGAAVARSGLLPGRTLNELEQTLAASGLHGRNGISLFVGSKILLFLAAPLITLILVRALAIGAGIGQVLPFVAAGAGLLLPDRIVRRNRQRYLARLDRGVPDMLDLLVICTQAGLGLFPALQRVSAEVGHAHPEVAKELAQTTSEMHIAVDSSAALISLAARTGLESLKRLTTTLVQTMQYGTPITEALRALAAEMRQEMLTRYEEKAARLPVVLTIPMIVFLLPCVFIVVGGPAVIQIMKAFNH
ncbi:MAG: type II secretion system F family protein [Acetobacteraceae bacterium]|nr:type II secretion system F family protein [Acetobacteraceae bacterium]MBV8522958.1 type II secretion system F family protein [Acetobacteraceae bacterium]